MEPVLENFYRLTIVIPVYNVSKYIGRCLQSLLRQMTNEIEIILVDDETPDNSITIAKSILDGQSEYRIISQTNRGLGGARNTGLREAKGEYVWFVDSDDEIEDDAINKIIHILDYGYDLFVFGYRRINGENTTSVIKYPEILLNKTGPELCSFFHQSQVWCCIYNRQFLLNYSLLFREHFLHEDGEFNMRAFIFAKKTGYDPTVVYKYHDDNDGSIMHNISIINQKDLLAFLDTRDTLYTDCDLSKQQKDVIDSYVRSAMGLLFYNALFLNKEEMKLYRDLICKNKKRILEVYNNLNLRQRIPIILDVYLPYKQFYRFVYRNHD